jgi:energy-converting hydrogenase Eha subunit H
MAPCHFFFPSKYFDFCFFLSPKKTALVQFALIFIVTTLPKFATKETLVEAVTRLMYIKNKTKQDNELFFKQ